MGFQRIEFLIYISFIILVSIPDGDAWVFKGYLSARRYLIPHEFQSPMGMHGFSKLVADIIRNTMLKFQSPMGMHGFSKGEYV